MSASGFLIQVVNVIESSGANTKVGQTQVVMTDPGGEEWSLEIGDADDLAKRLQLAVARARRVDEL